MIPQTDEENNSYKKQKACYICKKRFTTDVIIKSIIKSEIVVIILEIIELLLMIFVI